MPDLADEAQEAMNAHLQSSLAAAAPVFKEQECDGSGRIVCIDCGELIPTARLAAVPWACRCVSCQVTSDSEGHYAR